MPIRIHCLVPVIPTSSGVREQRAAEALNLR